MMSWLNLKIRTHENHENHHKAILCVEYTIWLFNIAMENHHV